MSSQSIEVLGRQQNLVRLRLVRLSVSAAELPIGPQSPTRHSGQRIRQLEKTLATKLEDAQMQMLACVPF